MTSYAGHLQAMLTRSYIEALLVDEELADQVCYMWESGGIDDDLAATAWLLISIRSSPLREAIPPRDRIFYRSDTFDRRKCDPRANFCARYLILCSVQPPSNVLKSRTGVLS